MKRYPVISDEESNKFTGYEAKASLKGSRSSKFSVAGSGASEERIRI